MSDEIKYYQTTGDGRRNKLAENLYFVAIQQTKIVCSFVTAEEIND